ncbi:MAG: DUF1499 domain-containing protein [Gammaproteobacteria bacterium]|nr:DUF1499 domain-containing protein [Gammaproteobacteria bacterium]
MTLKWLKPEIFRVALITIFLYLGNFYLGILYLGGNAMASSTEVIQSDLTRPKLQHCPDKPNCINTEYPEDNTHYLPAIDYIKSDENQLLTLAKQVIAQMGGVLVKEEKYTLSATFTSSIFKFVDDFEIRQDTIEHKLHIRSASRTGYSDFGVNKKRVKSFSEQLQKTLSKP